MSASDRPGRPSQIVIRYLVRALRDGIAAHEAQPRGGMTTGDPRVQVSLPLAHAQYLARYFESEGKGNEQ